MGVPGLANKVVLVTGGGRGIGRAIAEAFAEAQSFVVIGDINKEESDAVVSAINERFGEERATSYRLDVTNYENAKEVVSSILSRFGKIDILVNNAGVSTMAPVIELTERDWDFNMNVNAKGVFIMSQLVVRSMIERNVKGKIVNIASQGGRQGFPFLAHYCASKFAVIGFTQSLALEVAKYGITVNAVCPGFVKTSMQEREIEWEAKLRGVKPREVIESYLKSIPLGRLQEPKDVANVVLFLASSLADYITGASIEANGGSCMV
jgi:NAD(P)-dependent dehydrogenase (short-subunit alcohol dehydrogenase family)